MHMPIDVDFQMKEMQREKAHTLDMIGEESEDESVSDIESDESEAGDVEANSLGIDPSEYLQAFSHFTKCFTNKRLLVCDLQGVFNTHTSPPTIELTDPAIHYASAKGRSMVFGRTDKGRSGMNTFFKTHKCNNICKYLHLSAKNKRWDRNWRHESSQSTNFHQG